MDREELQERIKARLDDEQEDVEHDVEAGAFGIGDVGKDESDSEE